MSKRHRLLFLCQTLPYPPDGGVWIRSYHVLRLLALEFDVTALCFERSGASGARGEYDVERGVSALSRFGSVEAFPLLQNRSRTRLAWNHLRSVMRGRVYTRFVYESKIFRSRVEEILGANEVDLIHVDSLDLSAYLPLCDGRPTVCVHHNVESELLRRRADFEGGKLIGRYYAHQAALMLDEERHWAPQATLNVMVSEDDRNVLARLTPGARTLVVPNGVDIEEFRPEPGLERGVAYVGGTTWFPNLDALRFFCADILPHLLDVPDVRPVRWVGSATPEEQRHYRERYGVELTGYVDDVRPYMHEALCHVVPLRAGGGTRLKILNSWATGKPVVSTTIGCEGLDAVDGENILIRDDPRDFADAIRQLALDPSMRARLGENARRTAEESYSWDVVGRDMLRAYLDLL